MPPPIDRAARRRAQQEGKSLNAVAMEALARGLGLEAEPVEHTDLDALIGTWQEDPAFDAAVADFQRGLILCTSDAHFKHIPQVPRC